MRAPWLCADPLLMMLRHSSYRTAPDGSEWRPIEISMKGEGRLRAPEGVYLDTDE